MAFDILTFGEALVEVMRTGVDQPLDRPGPFTGPYPSGAPFIFAVQAARLGAKVAAIGAVGNDPFGRCLMAQLRKDGIETKGMRVLPTHATGIAFVAYASDGSRDFVFHVQHAAAGQLSPDLLAPSMFDELRVLHLMGSTLSINEQSLQTGLRALELAQIAGAKVSFDPNLRPQLMSTARARDVFAPFVAAADVLMPTVEEAQLLTGTTNMDQAVATLLKDKPDRVVVVTRGAAGSTIFTSAGAEPIPSFPVQEVDPTGAGDCFDAGFLVRWLARDPLAQAARFANACGALAVTAQGPMAGAQTADAVKSFIDKQTKDIT